MSLVLLASIIALFFYYQKDFLSRPRLKGQPLIAEQTLNTTNEIIISRSIANEPLILKKNVYGFWSLPQFQDWPANTQKLQNFVYQLTKGSLIRSVTEDPERIEKLELGNYTITLKDANSDTLWTLSAGKWGPSGGLFIRLNDNPEVLLADFSLFADPNVDNWMEQRVLNFPSSQVSKISLKFSNQAQALELSKLDPKASFISQGLETLVGATLQVNQAAIEGLLSTLLTANFEDFISLDDDVVTRAKAAIPLITIDIQQFGGEVDSLKIVQGLPQVVSKKAQKSQPRETDARNENTSKRGWSFFDFISRLWQKKSPSISDTIGEKSLKPSLENPLIDSSDLPLFIFYTKSSGQTHHWTDILSRVALTFPKALLDSLPKTMDELLEPKDENSTDH